MREQRGWSQTQLARAAGMTQPAIARFEADGTAPTLPVVERIAPALGADLAVRITPRTESLDHHHPDTRSTAHDSPGRTDRSPRIMDLRLVELRESSRTPPTGQPRC
jgi:transcriptional regulator with XRE-family HTH domain